MAEFGFCAGSYTSQSVTADSQTCMNLYPELIESGQGKGKVVLYHTPGLKTFATLSDSPVRGAFYHLGRLFVVAGATLFEVNSDATFVNRGAVVNDGLPASFAGSQIELCAASGGTLYILNLSTNALNTPSGLSNVLQVGFSDSYFLALIKNSAKVYISDILNGQSWPGAQFISVNVFPDNIVSMIADHREVALFGPKQSVVYQDTGSSNIFDLVPGGYAEQGCGAAFSPIRIDNTVFWIGADERGGGMAWRAQGYTPQRISTHAIEYAWSQYPSIADAVSYAYQDQGHSFWVIYFPTGNPNATWVYDVATGLWHERGFWDVSVGRFNAHRSMCHAYAFGKHLVGDWNSGKLYEMSPSYLDDAGSAIRRVRRSPHLAADHQWLYHKQLVLDMETGLGPQPPLTDGAGNARGPLVNLRWSDDGAHTWSNEYARDCGQAGKFKTRVQWQRLGRARDRVYEVSMTDPIAWRLVNAYLDYSAAVAG